MAVYFITGKLGSGKTLVTIGKVQEYLRRGRKVATNLDINIDKIVNRRNKSPIYRLPDKPRPEDLDLIGEGSSNVDESTFGLIVLDECGTWLNTRTYRDKERTLFIDWMLHSRKLGWDILFIIQDIGSIDKQVRDNLCEHLVVAKRLDRLPVPILSFWAKRFTGKRLTMPKVHLAKVFYGDNEAAMVADRWTYRGHDLYNCYDTRQVFKDDIELINDQETDMRATFTQLSHWHLKGRYHVSPFSFPLPRNLFEVLLYPTWLLIQLSIKLDKDSARSTEALS